MSIVEIYPVAVSFTRRFHAGCMNGVSASDVLRFVDRQSAARWVRGIRSNSRSGALTYSITIDKITA